jgi:hypothetical protein
LSGVYPAIHYPVFAWFSVFAVVNLRLGLRQECSGLLLVELAGFAAGDAQQRGGFLLRFEFS